jgi:hypothetical protein
MIENLNKLTDSIIFNEFILTMCILCVLMAQARNDYNINTYNTSLRIILCFVVILCIEMMIQMIVNLYKLIEVEFLMHLYASFT